MNISRTGAHRNAGTSNLTSEDLTKRTNYSVPKWAKDTHHLHFTMTGTDRGSSYRYYISMSAAEVVSFIESAIPALTADAASRAVAVAVGAAACLRELLVPKEPAAKQK